jgi:hypothetical protein
VVLVARYVATQDEESTCIPRSQLHGYIIYKKPERCRFGTLNVAVSHAMLRKTDLEEKEKGIYDVIVKIVPVLSISLNQ